ncbi:phenylalanine--tRNA ligase subunit beta [Halomicrobium sp. LC1Hm]|uniref:phenylalanine--tRNA ligase subunit beta n=1 Tax=Halomicrobium sp. LC1Hm TaxID=2610902 RepID=UPI0012983568|nr:phenylalanine--tRNA ligase subunit beta [Halomicrobium sp. LC1Hm]QGA84190.1 Phenylalanyl-tRNA synthetase beta subunit [Halomicrobium sp. LC1Hm]
MPTVDIDPDELRELTGHSDKSDDELRDDLFSLGLEYEGETDEGHFELEFAPDRLDRLSVEGIARSLRYDYGDDRGVYVPSTNDPEWTIEVEDTPPERPYVTGAIVRGLDLDESSLDSLIQLQEKLHATMGRKRAKGAIGVHDLTMLKGGAANVTASTPPDEAVGDLDSPAAGPASGDDEREAVEKTITYTGIDPDSEEFVPLEGDRAMTPAEVTEEHHIGVEYAELVAEMDRVPAIYDSIGLFSFPPVINGKRTEVDTGSRDLFVEMTGTDQWTIDHMLSIVCYALDARGGTVEEVTVEYTDGAPGEYAGQSFVRPDLGTKTKTVAHDRIETILGVDLDKREIGDLADRAGLDASETDTDGVYEFEIPPYRVDVLHPIDVIDDLGRAYGFNTLEPRYPDVSTVGGRHDRSKLERATRDVLVGLGFEDLLNFHMISEEENYERLQVTPGSDAVGGGDPVTIQEPYSEDYTMLRSWALPSIMLVLENNTHRSYPQDLAEIGLAAEVDESTNTNVAEHRTVAAAVARHDASYEDAKTRLQAIAANFGKELATPPIDHPTFIDGRTAAVELDGETVGVVGEIDPAVLVEHDLEVPVAAFEFRLDALE